MTLIAIQCKGRYTVRSAVLWTYVVSKFTLDILVWFANCSDFVDYCGLSSFCISATAWRFTSNSNLYGLWTCFHGERRTTFYFFSLSTSFNCAWTCFLLLFLYSSLYTLEWLWRILSYLPRRYIFRTPHPVQDIHIK